MPRWINNAYRLVGTSWLCVALVGCSLGPRPKDLLPDEGPTTREVYDRHISGQIATPIATPPATTSSYGGVF